MGLIRRETAVRYLCLLVGEPGREGHAPVRSATPNPERMIMPTVDDGMASQIRNIEERYGKPLPEWFAVIAASGLAKHNEVVAMLKAEHGMANGAAHRVSLLSRQAAVPAPASAAAATDDLYTGKKAGLRPLHDQLMTVVNGFGDDVTVAAKKGYLSLRRARQFAMIQPSAAGRLDVGLILPGVPRPAAWSRRAASMPCSATGSG